MKTLKSNSDIKPPDPAIDPTAHLSDSSKELFRMVLCRISNPERIALLISALEARDRAEQARLAIEVEGMISKTEKTGVLHVHPLIKVERESRAQFAMIWTRLGLNLVPSPPNPFEPWP